MKFVTEFSLMMAIEKTENLEEERIVRMMEEFADKQPYLFGFIMSMEELFEDEFDFQSLLQMAFIIWLSFELEFRSLPKVMEEDIVRREAESMDHLQKIEQLVESGEMGLAFDFLGQNRQPVLVHFVAEELVTLGEGSELSLGDETAGKMFPVLKMIVDLLDDVINRPRLRVV